MAKRCQRSSAAEARQSTLTPCSYVSHRMTQSMHCACFMRLHLYLHHPGCVRARAAALWLRAPATSAVVHASCRSRLPQLVYANTRSYISSTSSSLCTCICVRAASAMPAKTDSTAAAAAEMKHRSTCSSMPCRRVHAPDSTRPRGSADLCILFGAYSSTADSALASAHAPRVCTRQR